MSQIVALEVENIKRIRALRITPDGKSLVIIAGDNGAGKTSVLDSIVMALGGDKYTPPKPIREGAEAGHIVLETDALIVTRRYTPKGTILKVTDKEGKIYPSPQRMLDALLSKVAFDPLRFADAGAGGAKGAREQRDMLLELVGLKGKLEDADRERLTATTHRRDLKADLARAQAKLEGMRLPAEPAAGDDTAALHKKLQAAQDANEAARRAKAEFDANLRLQQDGLRAAREAYRVAQDHLAAADRRIAEIEAELAGARDAAQRLRAEVKLDELARDGKERAATVAQLLEQEGGLPAEVDVRPLIEQAGKAHALEAERIAYRAAVDAREGMRGQVGELAKEVEEAEGWVERCDAQKKALLDGVKMPIDGLSVDDDGVLYKGVPLVQASGAEQLRVSVAVAMRMHPQLKVLRITQGPLLDDKSMAMLEEMARAEGYQIWVERVGKDDEGAIIIEDGEVAGAAPAAAE